MNFLERVPIRWLLAGAGAACLALWAAPSSAQTPPQPDPRLGQELFENTPAASGRAGITNSCVNCHATVANRRIAIGGSAHADISYQEAITRFTHAVSIHQPMNQFIALDSSQTAHLAAYLADTPKVAATALLNGALDFETFAPGQSAVHSLTVQHAVATTENLQIRDITLGPGNAAFQVSSACRHTVAAPAGQCTFSVTYQPTAREQQSRTLTIALQQGAEAFERTVTLRGTVAGAMPAPPPGDSGDPGGGALGAAWLAGLAAATLALARRPRR